MAGGGVSVSAQAGRAGSSAAGGEQAGISPLEIQRMFDASALLQAQKQLDIRDDQFAQFLVRFKALQDTRRQALVERMQILQQLSRLLNAGAPFDEGAVKDRLKAIEDLDARQAGDVARAYVDLDQVLDVRQRAQFRLFEEVMERQKLQLITRARQLNRPRQEVRPSP
jgi:Spy/CpxP family protein refolding chaperone